jgi:hypothetical protein
MLMQVDNNNNNNNKNWAINSHAASTLMIYAMKQNCRLVHNEITVETRGKISEKLAGENDGRRTKRERSDRCVSKSVIDYAKAKIGL